MESRFKLMSRTGTDDNGAPVYFSTQISEPVGFDGFSSKLVRNAIHGISAEFSDSDLEFDSVASDVIRAAYQNIGIDAEILLVVEQSCNGIDWDEVYRGMIDFTTYSDNTDQYRYVKCKTGDVGVMTTFNNRMSDSVLMNAVKGADGGPITSYSNINKEITLPAKKIIVTNKASAENITGEVTIVGTYNSIAFSAPFGTSSISEFGDFIVNDGTNNMGYEFQIGNSPGTNIMKNINPVIRYVESDVILGPIHIEAYIHAHDQFGSLSACRYNRLTDTPIYYSFDRIYNTVDRAKYTLSIDIEPLKENEEFFIYAIEGFSGSYTIIDAYLKMTSLSTYKDSKCKVSMIHETLSHVAEYITDGKLTVKSNWFGRPDSEINPAISTGGGSMRCLANGLRIRNATLTDGSDGYFSVTMKELYDSLNAIDNIGMGFSVENGILYIRIEPWKWFYKSNTVLTINSPSRKTREVDTDNIFSRVKIGYKKYTDIEDTNGLDAFHTVREYSTRIKAIENELELLSKFVADPYALEYTRRKSLDKDTNDWKYDDEIFIICLKSKALLTPEGVVYAYMVDTSLTNSDNSIVSPETIYNVRISPARNAMRWSDRILSFIGASMMYFSTAVSNANAKGKAYNVISETSGNPPVITATYNYGYDPGTIVQENQSIEGVGFLRPEKVYFEYPLEPFQLKAIKDNPYGRIVVDGEICYLSELEYQYKDGIAKFTVIPQI